jgi:uncharacterized protein
VLRAALRRALELTERGDDVWSPDESSFGKVLRRHPLTIREHLEIDDSDVIFHLKQWRRADDRILSDLSDRFVARRLFKAIDLDMPLEERADFIKQARVIVSQAGFAPEYYFIEDRASDVPYYGYYTGEGEDPRKRIYVEDGYARPHLREISEVSEAVRGLRRGYELHRVCFPAEVKESIYRLYHAEPRARQKSAARNP